MTFDRTELAKTVATLAQRGVFIGTSSWKYSGWCGQLYDEQRYMYRGKLAQSRLEKDCLTEYAEVFKTVCVDAGYYRFPDDRYVSGLVSQVPADFLLTFKVTDEITIKKFSNLPRHRDRAGKQNENFLDDDLFGSAFVQTFGRYKQNVGMRQTFKIPAMVRRRTGQPELTRSAPEVGIGCLKGVFGSKNARFCD